MKWLLTLADQCALFPPRALPLSDSQEEKEGERMSEDGEKGRGVFFFFFFLYVCLFVRARGGGRVLAGHLMIFAMAAPNECCWRKRFA